MVSWTCLDTRSGPDLAMVAEERSCLVEEVGGGFRTGVRWRVVARASMCGSSIRHVGQPAGSSGSGTAAARTRRVRRVG